MSDGWLLGERKTSHGAEEVVSWLQSNELLTSIATTMSDLQEAIANAKEQSK